MSGRGAVQFFVPPAFTGGSRAVSLARGEPTGRLTAIGGVAQAALREIER